MSDATPYDSKTPSSGPASVEVVIEKLVAGGDGLGFHDGRAVFVSDVVPGDRVLVRLVRHKKDFVRGVVESFVEEGPGRQEPACPVAKDCGGCSLQHMTYDAQVDAKKNILIENLRRTGGIELPFEPSVHRSAEWGYRLRTNLQVEWIKGTPVIGYFRRRSHDVVRIDDCPILRPGFAPLFRAVVKLVTSQTHLFRGLDSIGYLEGDDGVVATFHFTKHPSKRGPLFAALREICEAGDIKGAIVEDPSGRVLNWGQIRVTQTIDETRFTVEPGAFVQTHRDLSQALWRRVRELAASRREKKAFDLYGGAGFFATALAPHFDEVTSVEANPAGVSLAKQNMRANGIENVKSVRMAVIPFLERRGTHLRSSFVVIDPPRQGLEIEVRQRLGECRVSAIYYISCDSTTLARDLQSLTASGFAIESVDLYDFFPHTAHFETAVLLRSIKEQ